MSERFRSYHMDMWVGGSREPAFGIRKSAFGKRKTEPVPSSDCRLPIADYRFPTTAYNLQITTSNSPPLPPASKLHGSSKTELWKSDVMNFLL